MKYGRRLLPPLVDEIAASDPGRVLVSHPTTSDGYRDVTFPEFARAVNRCSWLLKDKLGSSNSFKTLFYLGPQDLRLLILVLAAVKTGHKLFLSMSRLVLDAQLALLQDLQCRTLLSPTERLPVADEILSKWEMQILTVPSLEELLEAPDVEVYQYDKKFEQARHEPFICLHTSGSTGRPKPVILKHGTVTHHDLWLQMPKLGGRTLNHAQTQGSRILLGLPSSHSAGMCFMAYAIYSNTTVVFPPSYPVTADMANTLHASGAVDGSFLPPIVLIELAKNPEYLESIRRLRYLTFGGAPLPRAVGHKIKNYTHLFVSFGATETGFYALESTEPEDWEYVRFSPFMGHELRDVGGGLYEFYFVRQDHLRDFQGAFATFPELQTYSPHDLYSKHPHKDGLWLYEGRSDDLIVASHGQKFNPTAMEGLLQTHPNVHAALVCGDHRPRNALLIEPTPPPGDGQDGADPAAAILPSLWPLVEQANAQAPEYARIDRRLIVFTSPERPMVRADKGSVLRKLTADAYGQELDEVYEKLKVTGAEGLYLTE